MKKPNTLLDSDGLKKKGIRYSNARLSQLEAAGRFPKRVRMSGVRHGWVEREIDHYIAALIAERDRAEVA